MNWQNTNDLDYIKAYAVLTSNDMYNNVAIGNKYSTGGFGSFYDKTSELKDELDFRYDSIEDILDNLKEQLDYELADENIDTELVSNLKSEINILESESDKTKYLDTDAFDNNQEIKYVTDNQIEELYLQEYLEDSMSGHSFAGTIQEAKEKIIEQLSLKEGGLKKDTFELVNFCEKEFSQLDNYEILESINELKECYDLGNENFISIGDYLIINKNLNSLIDDITNAVVNDSVDFEDSEIVENVCILNNLNSDEIVATIDNYAKIDADSLTPEDIQSQFLKDNPELENNFEENLALIEKEARKEKMKNTSVNKLNL